jgi:hypothetical protein
MDGGRTQNVLRVCPSGVVSETGTWSWIPGKAIWGAVAPLTVSTVSGQRTAERRHVHGWHLRKREREREREMPTGQAGMAGRHRLDHGVQCKQEALDQR